MRFSTRACTKGLYRRSVPARSATLCTPHSHSRRAPPMQGSAQNICAERLSSHVVALRDVVCHAARQPARNASSNGIVPWTANLDAPNRQDDPITGVQTHAQAANAGLARRPRPAGCQPTFRPLRGCTGCRCGTRFTVAGKAQQRTPSPTTPDHCYTPTAQHRCHRTHHDRSLSEFALHPPGPRHDSLIAALSRAKNPCEKASRTCIRNAAPRSTAEPHRQPWRPKLDSDYRLGPRARQPSSTD